MQQEAHARTPQDEVLHHLPFVAQATNAQSEMLASGAAHTLAMVSLVKLKEEAEAGVPEAQAVLHFLGDRLEGAAATLAGLAESEAGLDERSLAALAARLDEAGKGEAAARILAIAAGGKDEVRADGMLGLSILAARNGVIDDAAILASAAITGDARHPRALSVLGICELARGNLAQAQAQLAAAARLARRDPSFRDEMQVAQRALLLMHLRS